MSALLPLDGIRVLDVGTFLAAPFAAGILADFGAEVIKIEQPGVGDPLRRFGTPTECGDTLIWLSEARNKKFMTLDLKQKRGAELLGQLAAKSDVLIENFRPGTLKNWGLGHDTLSAINPKLVTLSVSAYGQDGPARDLPGFARVAHAFSGLSYLAGESGRQPVVPGSTSLADYVSGMWGAIGILLALREVGRSGKGQTIDVSLYESIFRLLDELVPAYRKFGIVRERMGADVMQAVPHGHWQCADGKWIAVACSSDKIFDRLAVAMGRPELAGSREFGSIAARVERRTELNAIVADWVASMTSDQAILACREGQVPCGKLMAIDDIMVDPQYLARRAFVEVTDERVAELMLPTQPLRMSRWSARLDHAGGAMGKDTDAILSNVLGLTAAEIDELRAGNVV